MLKFNEEKQGLGWKCQCGCQAVTRGVFRWGCLQKLHWGLAPPGKASLLHLLLTNTDSIVCHPIKKQQLYWKKEWDSAGATSISKKKHLTQRVSPVLQTVLILLVFPHPFHSEMVLYLPVGAEDAEPIAPKVPVLLHSWASQLTFWWVCLLCWCPGLPCVWHSWWAGTLLPAVGVAPVEQWWQPGPGAPRSIHPRPEAGCSRRHYFWALLSSCCCWPAKTGYLGKEILNKRGCCSSPCVMFCNSFDEEFVVAVCVSGGFGPLHKLNSGSHYQAVLSDQAKSLRFSTFTMQT